MDTNSGRIYRTPQDVAAARGRGENLVPVSEAVANRMDLVNTMFDDARPGISAEVLQAKRDQLRRLSRFSRK